MDGSGSDETASRTTRTAPTRRATKARPLKAVKVAFTLPAGVDANDVALCGDFNEWRSDDIKLARDGNGGWSTTVALEPGRAYRYRYLLDGQRWENAWNADQYVPNPYGGDDSVLVE
jgi:1,4-alpha-glucan branching enzyme